MWPTSLPWAIQVLIADAIITIPILAVITARGVRYGGPGGIAMVLWNVATVLLILMGGTWSWQHVTYASLSVLSTTMSVRNVAIKKRVPPSEYVSQAIAGGFVLTLFILYLLVSGAR